MSSEDMDSLTFGATRLVRNLMAPAAAKLTINEYDYDKVGHLSTLVYGYGSRWLWPRLLVLALSDGTAATQCCMRRRSESCQMSNLHQICQHWIVTMQEPRADTHAFHSIHAC